MRPPTPKEILALFNKFAGQVLKDPDRSTCDTDETLEAMKKIATKYGYSLCVHFPNEGPQSHLLVYGRISASAEKEPDGKYHVGKNFSLG